MFMSMRTLSVVYFLIIYSGISHFTTLENSNTRKPPEPVVSSYKKPKPVDNSYKKKETSPNTVPGKERLSKVLGMTYPSTPLGHYDPLSDAKKRIKERGDEKPEKSSEVAESIRI